MVVLIRQEHFLELAQQMMVVCAAENSPWCVLTAALDRQEQLMENALLTRKRYAIALLALTPSAV
jgi:hypothetical protein